MYVPPCDLPDWPKTKLDEMRLANLQLRRQLRHERRARNIMATLALVGWVLALAALGGAV